ncbi:MAG: ATP-binding protein [Phycisphaerales bacterium]
MGEQATSTQTVPTPVEVSAVGVPAPSGRLSPSDLAELVESFGAVTARLEATHAQLRGEVSRLNEELRHANAQIERSRRLAALGEMAAGISHEVRNPLASIRLYARMLEEDLADRPEQRGVATKIAGAVTRLDAIVGDVLTFAREIRVRAHACDADALFDEALGLCELKGVEVDRSALAAMDLSCDAGLCVQALVNLVRNAVEAMEGRGRLRVSAREACELDGSGAEGHWAVLSVHDSGPGIPPDVVERMFNPFFTTRATGTGLGLAIVHRILDAHSGRVEVVSKEGQGATVELWFPSSTPRAASTGSGSLTTGSGARTAAA